jgi:hypothetical protein
MADSTVAPFTVLGNCQTGSIANCIQALTAGPPPEYRALDHESLRRAAAGIDDLSPFFEKRKRVFVQPLIWEALAPRYAKFHERVALFPSIAFMAYHPDLTAIPLSGSGLAFVEGPCGVCNSSIIFLGWKAGLNPAQAEALFCQETFERLGYFDWWPSSFAALVEEGKRAGLPLEDAILRWRGQESFMYCHLHPKVFAMADMTEALLRREGIPVLSGKPGRFLLDQLVAGPVWPVYPELARALGCEGSYLFKAGDPSFMPNQPIRAWNLRAFIEGSYQAYSRHAPEYFDFSQREQIPQYRDFLADLRQRKTSVAFAAPAAAQPAARPAVGTHPYRGLPSHRYWRDAVAPVPFDQLDPVVRAPFTFSLASKVAVAGSCFAQRLCHRLRDGGFNLLRTEPISDRARMAGEDELPLGSGDEFSARYGNVYTPRQLRQLIDRAFGKFTPVEPAWQMKSGRYADPFRPNIDQAGFASVAELEADRARHLAAVRQMFETLDVFVFTMGLTEAWRSKVDGAVFPLAPGVSAGNIDYGRHEFVNFRVGEMGEDLSAFLDHLKQVNPTAKVVLTVSPVPIAATYRDQHVLVSSSSTKSALRAAVDEALLSHPDCAYFPSYEVVTGPHVRGAYWGEDLRSVTPAGIERVMRLFLEHYASATQPAQDPGARPEILKQARDNLRALCDEDLVVAASS